MATYDDDAIVELDADTNTATVYWWGEVGGEPEMIDTGIKVTKLTVYNLIKT